MNRTTTGDSALIRVLHHLHEAKRAEEYLLTGEMRDAWPAQPAKTTNPGSNTTDGGRTSRHVTFDGARYGGEDGGGPREADRLADAALADAVIGAAHRSRWERWISPGLPSLGRTLLGSVIRIKLIGEIGQEERRAHDGGGGDAEAEVPYAIDAEVPAANPFHPDETPAWFDVRVRRLIHTDDAGGPDPDPDTETVELSRDERDTVEWAAKRYLRGVKCPMAEA